METEEINYQALYEQVQEELRAARLTILKLRYNHSVVGMDLQKLRKLLAENYVLIIVAVMILSVLLSLMDTVYKFRRRF